MIFLQLFLTFFQIGLFGFGGGYAMISLIQGQVVSLHHWMTMGEFTDVVAISQMTPGPIGINSATYIGYTVGGGVMGSMVTTLAVILPSFLLVLYTSRFIQKHKDSHYIKGIFAALRPVVVGLIGSAALLLMNRENFDDLFSSIAICAVCFVMAFFYKIHPILIIVLAGLTGYIIY